MDWIQVLCGLSAFVSACIAFVWFTVVWTPEKYPLCKTPGAWGDDWDNIWRLFATLCGALVGGGICGFFVSEPFRQVAIFFLAVVLCVLGIYAVAFLLVAVCVGLPFLLFEWLQKKALKIRARNLQQ